MRKVGILLILACFLGLPALAQVPDFQAIMNNLPAKLDGISAGAWSAGAYAFVDGPTANPSFAQSTAAFAGQTHIHNGIQDDDHLALLQAILVGDACTRELLGDTFVNNVQTAFNANRANVTNRETNFKLRLFDSTRIDIDYVISASNRPAYTDGPAIQTFTTGQANTLRLCVDSGIFIVGTTCLSESVDIPSMWGPEGLLNEGSPGLGDDLRDLLAAYITIGSQAKVDYVQGIMFETMYRGLLPNIMEVILGLMKGVPAEPVVEYDMAWDQPVDDKAYMPGTVESVHIDESYSPPMVVSDSDPYIAIRRVVARVYNEADGGYSIEQGVLQDWLHWYKVGDNGFNNGFPNEFTALGDLDGNGEPNITAYTSASGDRADFIVNAGAGVKFFFANQPQQPAAPVPYGTQIFFDAHAEGGAGVTGPITYQWYAGPTPGALAPITGQTGSSYNPVIDFYSFGGATTQHYYQVQATTFACSDNITVNSTTVTVTGGAPPAINIEGQPAGADLQPGQNATFTVNAVALAGSPWYQWQKYDPDFESWFNIDGVENPSAVTNQLVITGVTPEDAGQYRCRIYNEVNDKSNKANPVYWIDSDAAILNVAPAIEIDPQPIGGDVEIGDNFTITAGASVDDGNLEFKWQKNAGFGYVDLTAWVNTGATSLSEDWVIVNATINDSGAYRLQVRNTLAPYGTYQVNSAGATLNVSSGVIYYVDPTGDNSNGLSWETAFHGLQDAIDAANGAGGGEVWVAGGPPSAPIVYGGPRTIPWGGATGDPGRQTGSLVMRSNVGLYGGFEGYRAGAGVQEENRLDRNRALNVAVIDGSQARGGNPAFHVVVFGHLVGGTPEPTTNAVLDGFVITGGDAAGVNNDYHTWRGGGIYNWGSSPTIANCIITGNRAAVSGGGIANEVSPAGQANPTLINCLIHNNVADREADGGPGAGAPPHDGNPIRGGGGIFNNQSSPFVSFATIVANTVDNTYEGPIGDFGQITFGLDSGGVYTWDEDGAATPLVTNAIVHDNSGSIVHDHASGVTPATTVTYSIVEGGWAGTGNDDVDPLLGNAAYVALLGTAISDFLPSPASPALDTGDHSIAGGDDLLGVLRPLNATGVPSAIVDRGAFELSVNDPAPNCASIAIDFTVTPDTDAIDVFDVFDGGVFEAPVDTVELTYYAFDCVDIPETQIEVVVTDTLGRTGACLATVSVTESIAPVPVANPMTVELDATGNYALTAADVVFLSAGSTDNCTAYDDLIITATPNAFTCAQAGQNVNVQIRVEDEQGNFATATAVVTVEDNSAPIPPDPANSVDVVLLPNGAVTISAALTQQLATGTTDNCSVDLPATQLSRTNFTCADVGAAVEVDMTVYDIFGNSAVGTGFVNVLDETPPVFSGVTPRNFSTVGDDFTLVQALAGVSAEDACDGVVTPLVEVLDSNNDPVAFPIPANWDLEGAPTYVFRLIYTAQDNSLNERVAETTLTLVAVELPVITVLGDDPVTIECGDLYVDAGATTYDPEADQDITIDMTTDIPLDLTDGPVAVGVYTVTYAVDVPGYPELDPVEATRTVNVVDTEGPVFTGVTERGFSTIDVEYTEAQARAGVSAEDVCEGTVLFTVAAFDEGDNPVAFPIDPDAWTVDPITNEYVFKLVYTAADSVPNETIVETTLTLLAIQFPVITLDGIDPVEIECGDFYADAGATAYDPEADEDITDDMVTEIPAALLEPAAVGVYTVTYSVDVPGYPALAPVVATRTVNVVDTEPPVITLHVPETLYWQRGVAFPNDDTIRTALDTCDGDLTAAIVTTGAVDVGTLDSYALAYDVEDAAGLAAATVELTVIVIDELEFVEQPEGTRLYIDDDAYVMSAAYENGANVQGYQWFQDATGLGFEADTASPNTVTLAVDPSVLGVGNFQYHLAVTDDTGDIMSDDATVRVAARMTAGALDDIVLITGDNYEWAVSVAGGFEPRSYQWYFRAGDAKSFAPVVNGSFGDGAYGGAMSRTLRFMPFSEAMIGEYQVEVSDDLADTLTIGPATVTGGTGIPAAGMFGMAALALATALGGAMALRKRK